MWSIFRDRRAVALLLSSTLTVMSNAIISPALPGIRDAYADTPNVELLTRLLVAAPSLLVALFAPFAGMLADRFGRRRQLLLGVGLFGLCGSAGFWLPDMYSLFASRLILGLGVAMIMTAQTALVGDYFEGETRGRFMGLQMAATNFGGLILIAFAGLLANHGPFLPFALYAVALLFLPFLVLSLTEPDRAAAGHGAAQGSRGEPGWIRLLVASVILCALTFITFYIVPTQSAFYLPTIGYSDPGSAALLLMSMTFAAGVTSLGYGRLRHWLGRARIMGLGFGLMALAFVVLSFAHHLAPAAGSILIMGAGAGLIFPTMLSVALEVAPADRRGMAAGALTMAIFLGQFISPFVSLPLVSHYGFSSTFLVYAVILAVCALCALAIYRSRVGVPVRA